MRQLDKPKLRNVNVQRTIYQGQPVFIIQDGLRLTEAVVVLPQTLGPLALLCDGLHSVAEIRLILENKYGLKIPLDALENLLHQFDKALLLDSDYFRQVKQQAIDKYRAAEFREPALAGPSYPADPQTLRRLLQDYLDQVNGVTKAPTFSRGVISPHIDYQRGGKTYAEVWASAAEAVRQAELVIIFGTDHNGDLGTITLTPQNYATPLGVMPTDQAVVNRLAEILGPEEAFADELHHRGEHSIELALVWLQYLREGEPCPTVPVLCGSFQHFMIGYADIETEPKYRKFIEALRQETEKRRTVVVAAGDLAHLGPAFDGPPLDSAAYDQMKQDDDALMGNISQGRAEEFYNFMRAGQYERNVCGLSPFYFTLGVLGQTEGQVIAYERCPADANNTSFVSVCGMVLS